MSVKIITIFETKVRSFGFEIPRIVSVQSRFSLVVEVGNRKKNDRLNSVIYHAFPVSLFFIATILGIPLCFVTLWRNTSRFCCFSDNCFAIPFHGKSRSLHYFAVLLTHVSAVELVVVFTDKISYLGFILSSKDCGRYLLL